MKKIMMNSVLLISVLFIGYYVTGTVNAMSLKQRTAIIKGLKLKGIVGENNKGYVELRNSNKKFDKVVKEENAYRKSIYVGISKKQGVSVTKVGKERASQIAKKAAKGTWLQKANGSWYKK